MADVTVSSTGDYTIMIDSGDSSTQYHFALSVVDAASIHLQVGEETSTRPVMAEFKQGDDVVFEKDGEPQIIRSLANIGNTLELHWTNSSGPMQDRIMHIDSSRLTHLTKGSARINVFAAGSLPSSPTEGLLVFEANSLGTKVRIAAYLNGGWRKSGWLS